MTRPASEWFGTECDYSNHFTHRSWRRGVFSVPGASRSSSLGYRACRAPRFEGLPLNVGHHSQRPPESLCPRQEVSINVAIIAPRDEPFTNGSLNSLCDVFKISSFFRLKTDVQRGRMC